MPWSTTRKPGTQTKYRTGRHRQERARRMAEYKASGYTTCAQPVCVMSTRTMRWPEPAHLGHDDSGQYYIGLVHPKCNVKDGAKRGNARSQGKREQPRRWVL